MVAEVKIEAADLRICLVNVGLVLDWTAPAPTTSLKWLKWLFSQSCCFAQLYSSRQYCTNSCTAAGLPTEAVEAVSKNQRRACK